MGRLVRRFGKGGRPLMKSEIEEAQSKTISGMGAAKWLGVSYTTYKKYAKTYGIHEQHLNPKGIGVSKGPMKGKSPPLSAILSGLHPGYPIASLKLRLIKQGMLKEECSVCSFGEARITDHKKPLILTTKDGNEDNLVLSNLVLLCYNCAFLTTGQQADYVHTRQYRIDMPGIAEAEAVITDLELRNVPASTQPDIDNITLEAAEQIELSEEEKLQILRDSNDTRY
jgi:hypothetical protein